METIPEWLTLTEAAQYWGITSNTLRLRIHRKTIPTDSIRKSGGTWLISTAGMMALFGTPDDLLIENDITKKENH